MSTRLTVLKIGGSVLTGDHSCSTAVHEIYRHVRKGEKVIVVVSAFKGVTDDLLEKVSPWSDRSTGEGEALQLAVGELTSVAQIRLALGRAGIPARLGNPWNIGLTADADGNLQSVNTGKIYELLASVPVLVIPGFVALGADGELTLLGRGGSDYSALFLAHAVHASRCRLVKDVGGLYERDPHVKGKSIPRRLYSLSWQDAHDIGGKVIQSKALDFALEKRIPFEIAGFHSRSCTRIGNLPVRFSRHAPTRPLSVTLLGLGVVGYGVYQALKNQPELFEIKKIAVRDVSRALSLGVPSHLITTDAVTAAGKGTDIVIELCGGTDVAGDAVERALNSGSHVVTANKALLAERGEFLSGLARSRSLLLLYSAAVGGVVPMIERVRSVAKKSNICKVAGVVNGTCNFILNQVAAGLSFKDAVSEAQHRGFAEADPYRDLSGIDAAEKLILLAEEAFGVKLTLDTFKLEALSEEACELRKGAEPVAHSLRSVATIERRGCAVEGSVCIKAVLPEHALFDLPNAENRIAVSTVNGEEYVVSGAGAGRWPTTEAVIADLLDVSRRLHRRRELSSSAEIHVYGSPERPAYVV